MLSNYIQRQLKLLLGKLLFERKGLFITKYFIKPLLSVWISQVVSIQKIAVYALRVVARPLSGKVRRRMRASGHQFLGWLEHSCQRRRFVVYMLGMRLIGALCWSAHGRVRWRGRAVRLIFRIKIALKHKLPTAGFGGGNIRTRGGRQSGISR